MRRSYLTEALGTFVLLPALPVIVYDTINKALWVTNTRIQDAQFGLQIRILQSEHKLDVLLDDNRR